MLGSLVWSSWGSVSLDTMVLFAATFLSLKQESILWELVWGSLRAWQYLEVEVSPCRCLIFGRQLAWRMEVEQLLSSLSNGPILCLLYRLRLGLWKHEDWQCLSNLLVFGELQRCFQLPCLMSMLSMIFVWHHVGFQWHEEDMENMVD